jgi:threonine synthase
MRLVSTRHPRRRASFDEAIEACVPGDGGLFAPDPLPCFRDIPRLLEMDFLDRSTEILFRMLGEEHDREALGEVVREAFDFPVPLEGLGERMLALELFHGPTLAFQDFGARFLAGLLARLPEKPRTVLAATTGNTGAATARAFWKRKGFRVVVLHPRNAAPTLQERQIRALGENVRSFAVEGSYDDCRALVDYCFADRALASGLGLTSASSLNIGRIVAQVPLFFEAVARVQAFFPGTAPVIAVPCGDFGNLYSGLLAQRMGLPVKALVAATNANDAGPRCLESGEFLPRPAVATLSRDLDAGFPSNWPRIQALLEERPGTLRALLRWGRRSDEATLASMRELGASGWPPHPASAVAHGVLREHLGPAEVGIVLATAHPAKAAGLLRDRLDLDPGLPLPLAEIPDKPEGGRPLPAEFEALKAALQRKD